MSNLGWECPRCHAVYAPTITRCDGCSAAAAKKPEYSDLEMVRRALDRAGVKPLRIPQSIPNVPLPWDSSWWLHRPIFVGDPPPYNQPGTWSVVPLAGTDFEISVSPRDPSH